VSNDFKELCVKEVITRELNPPQNLHQNGVAKGKNRSVVGDVIEIFG